MDKELLKFLKLEELVLSANKIEEIDANNLPPTLKVHVLYGSYSPGPARSPSCTALTRVAMCQDPAPGF